MKIALVALLAVAAVGCVAQPASVNSGRQIAGKYEFIICQHECSFSNPETAFATATVVLFDRVLTLREMKGINPLYIDPHDVKECYEVSAQAGAFF